VEVFAFIVSSAVEEFAAVRSAAALRAADMAVQKRKQNSAHII